VSRFPAELAIEVASRYGVSGVAVPIVDGGDECELWRLASSPPVVVRVSPAWRSTTELAYSHQVAAEFGAWIPEVICPLVGAEGSTLFRWKARTVSVWPLIRGGPLDRENAALRDQAAGLLARLHRVTPRLVVSEPWRPAAVMNTGPARSMPDDDLDIWLDRWRRDEAAGEPVGLVHGDFYRRNIMCREGQIVGLIDWDDTHHDLLVADLAWAVWEMAKSPDGTMLLVDRADAFLTSYKAFGGPVRRSAALIPLIRAHLRYEVDRAEQAKIRGAPMDETYQAAEITAFHWLRNINQPHCC
jgi:Ser/Thr protein kinase RdoA (MazF antagonist)